MGRRPLPTKDKKQICAFRATAALRRAGHLRAHKLHVTLSTVLHRALEDFVAGIYAPRIKKETSR
jgi:hypothetical protein